MVGCSEDHREPKDRRAVLTRQPIFVLISGDPLAHWTIGWRQTPVAGIADVA